MKFFYLQIPEEPIQIKSDPELLEIIDDKSELHHDLGLASNQDDSNYEAPSLIENNKYEMLSSSHGLRDVSIYTNIMILFQYFGSPFETRGAIVKF